MKTVITQLSALGFNQACQKIREGKATIEEVDQLDNLTATLFDEVENALISMQSHASAFQSACEENEGGLFNPARDGLNFGIWLENQAATMQEMLFMANEARALVDRFNLEFKESGGVK
ncbi:hypothetical protein THMIRHAS_03860 [Thiosulfatimonas sediminis]|uniref:Uncharacterized protein n=1 Tax=Thiosulfatimonas sediminis TaxID=2675054 RepID=A0A6F8PSA9_9GAMM|nr:hypothetical protein [Thiosulfatimonas sediminis]BBP45013.1 hypothetical protein THMIRHAS_03860 [Thiosulfatimonas sediminis]